MKYITISKGHKNYEKSPTLFWRYIFTQSICTLIFNLSGWSDIFLGSGTLKKLGPKCWVQKAGCKKQGHCYSKEKRPGCLLSFWITMTVFFAPCFLHLIFCTQFFSGCQTDPCFQNENSGCRLTGLIM